MINMSKEIIKGFKEAFKAKGVHILTPRDLMVISKEQFQLKQNITELGNEMWKLKNTKLKHEQDYAKLEKEKDKIFIGTGLKEVKKLEVEKGSI